MGVKNGPKRSEMGQDKKQTKFADNFFILVSSESAIYETWGILGTFRMFIASGGDCDLMADRKRLFYVL